MAFFKRAFLVMSALGVAMTEPQSGPANTYLPPDQTGYDYQRPSVPFQPTAPGPSPPPGRPSPPPSFGPPPTGPSRPPYAGGNQLLGDEHHHDHHEPGMPYDFTYAVKDDYYGTDYSHNAISDGDVVKGEYRVQLPDGRLQIVRYTADWKTGFHADVSYEGQASYPEPSSGYNYQGPNRGGGAAGGPTYGPPAPSSPGY